jgi:O-antigen/teichoic acid export membrane protein
MELKILFKNSSYLIATKIVKFVVGIIRSKLIAIYLGTLGTGIISQLSQITMSMSQFTLMGMNNGLIKKIAESDKEEKGFEQKLGILLKSYMSIVSLFLIISIALLIIFSKQITFYVFGDIKYYGFFIISLVSFPILIINSFSYSILRAFKLIKEVARSELIVVVINLLFFIPLVYFWGITGAAIHVTFSFLTLLIVNHYYAKKRILNKRNISLNDILKAGINQKYIKELLLFAGFGLTAGLVEIFTEIITRSIVVTNLGIDQLGVYSPVISWGVLFTGFILPSVNTYLYPRFSESKSNIDLIGVLNDAFRFITILFIPFIFLTIPIRFQIITLFFSNAFKDAGNYLPWHLIGVFFFMWLYIFTQAMISTGRLKVSGVILIIASLVDITVAYYFIPKYGLYGWMLKFIISPIIFFIFYIFYFKKAIKFNIEKKNLLLMGYLVIAFILQMTIEKYLINGFKINFVIGICLTGVSLFMLSKSEKNLILNYLNRLKRK